MGGWYCKPVYGERYLRFHLNGDDPRADAYACHLMRERLIEWGYTHIVSRSFPIDRWVGWECEIFNVGPGRSRIIEDTPLEVLAVAEALIAVDEEWRKQSTDKEKTHE